MGAVPVARIWLASVDSTAASAIAAGTGWLGEDEAARLRQMTATARQRSFLAGHWLARQVAADWLQAGTAGMAVHRHGDGRPQLRVDGEPSTLSLSLSHSGDWLAIALATAPVGIDVELPRRSRDLRALARFTFSREEVARLDGLEEADYSAAFHRLWTLKEARGKRSGSGLLPGESRRVTSLPSDAGTAEATSWTLGDGALSIAVEPGTQVEIVGGEGLRAPAYWRYRDDR